jgi:cell division protein FtsZ
MPKASFVVANTDAQALKSCSRKVAKFQFGKEITHGLGTGMSADLGEEAAQQEKDKIKKLLEGQDLCILVACLGGGAGSGAVPVFAKISKNLGNLTYGIFTLPFKFEGDKKMEIAKESLGKVKNYLNALSIIPNERAFQIIDKSTPLKQALSIVNRILADSLGGLIETIYEPGLINIDFADFRTIMEGRGRLAYLNSVELQRREGSTKDLVTRVLNSPLYPYTIRGAKGVLFNIAGEKDLSLSEVNQISRTIADLVKSEAKIIFGISQTPKNSQIIKTTVLATGCGVKIFPSKPRKSRKKKAAIVPKLQKKESKAKKQKKSKPKNIKARKTKKVEKPKEKVLVPEPKPQEPPVGGQEQVRKNGLQIKKEAEELEKELIEKEKSWETPAFLKKKYE